MTKSHVKKLVRNIIISTVSLLILSIGVGVAYTWYMGQHSVITTADPVVVADTPVIKHVKPAANVRESASVQMLTSPIAPGSNAMITIRTNPDSKCTISVIYDKTPSTDSGLKAMVADEFGMITWTWTVESTVPIGKWPVKVTCVRGDQSAVVIGDLVVAK